MQEGPERVDGSGGVPKPSAAGGGQALTILQVNELLQRALWVSARRRTVLSPGMLRAGSRLLRPFNQVLSRQLQLGADPATLAPVIDAATDA